MHTQKKSCTAPAQALIPRCQVASACVAAADPSAPVIRNRRRPYQAHDGPYSPVERIPGSRATVKHPCRLSVKTRCGLGGGLHAPHGSSGL